MAGKFRWLLWMIAILVMVSGPFAMAKGEENIMNAYQTYLKTGEAPSLYKKYEGLFKIGAAVSPMWLKSNAAVQVITRNFNSLTCENEMKADFVMDYSKTVAAGDTTRVALNFQLADTVLSFARDNGMTMRAHTLVWHSQVPRWFFSANYEKDADAPLASRDVMEKRMENYIHDVMDYVNTKYPGIVYAWDVVNEAIEPADKHPNGLRTANNLWHQTLGDDFIELAFTYARKYAAPEQKLFYNDYNCYMKNKLYLIRNLLKFLSEKGLVDGLGMQGHIAIDTSLTEFEEAITLYSSLPIEIQVTELDIKTEDSSLLGQMDLASKYRRMFSMLTRLKERACINITSVTFWGLTDNRSWLNNKDHTYYPLLFNAAFTCKPAFFGVLQDESIPLLNTPQNLQNALDALGLEESAPRPGADSSLDNGIKKGYKGTGENNPVMTQRFGADPYALVYDGRVYLYMTGDVLEHNADGTVKNNTYSKINTINVLSSADLVNWTDHGAIRAAGSYGAASWASNSWAPAAAFKEIDGKMKFFLYFANNGGGIGVLTADSPTGPFTDPIGKPLVSRHTPNCADVTWLFDPAVLVDDDGKAYLYFGGGIPEGQAASPKTARAVQLGEDMTSIVGVPVTIDAPYLFEDSGINKIGDTYYYSYCTNFQVPKEKEAELGLANGQIHYMTSKSPLGPFEYAGLILKNPGDFFGCYGNNHHCMFSFEGKWYITYHTQTLEAAMGLKNRGYRCTFIDALTVDGTGVIAPVTATRTGAQQIKSLNPFERVEAETIAAMAVATTGLAPDANGLSGTGNGIVTATNAGGYVSVRGADFGEDGAGSLLLHARNKESATVKVLLDSLDSEAVYTAILVPSADFASQTFALEQRIQGIHDVYFVFENAGIELDWWQFSRSGA